MAYDFAYQPDGATLACHVQHGLRAARKVAQVGTDIPKVGCRLTARASDMPLIERFSPRTAAHPIAFIDERIGAERARRRTSVAFVFVRVT
jgi:hypothetical protein